jgi:hypothetical protein
MTSERVAEMPRHDVTNQQRDRMAGSLGTHLTARAGLEVHLPILPDDSRSSICCWLIVAQCYVNHPLG